MAEQQETPSQIPRITHRIWFQGWDKVPAKFHENIRLLEEQNPEFEHKTWDEHSLRKECELMGKPYLEKYDSLDLMIMKVDYGRYVALYRHGGISIDMDMKPRRPLRETPGIDTEEIILSTVARPVNYTGIINNAMFAVKPHSPYMKKLLDECTASNKTLDDYPNKEIYLNSETGPAFVTRILGPSRKKIKILDPDYFEPCFSMDTLCKPSEKTIMEHNHTLSWIDPMYHWIFRVLFYLYRFTPLGLIFVLIVLTLWWPHKLPKIIRPTTRSS
jgi:mannosyltransferase OCH1-like enzyme